MNDRTNYYNVLGVERSASADDIKQAYRKLANKHHPDKGGDTAQFQAINEAYSILSDPSKRQQYDNPQPQFNYTEEVNLDEILSRTFGFARQKLRKNRDMTIVIEIDLEDTLRGKSVNTNYTLYSKKVENVQFDVPRGAFHGMGIQFLNMGDDSNPAIPRGNLIVRIAVRPHPTWSVQNLNLYTHVNVDCLECSIGSTVDIVTLDKSTIRMKIPPGTQHGTVFSIPGHGLPELKTGKSGNALIKVNTVVPKITNEETVKMIEAIRLSLAL